MTIQKAIDNSKIDSVIEYCTSIIVKEARNEEHLVQQLLCTMLSTYTNNPTNLGINSPSGEGKNWVLKKVAEKFPKEDVTLLSHMTEKALFHKEGEYVIRHDNEWVPVEPMMEERKEKIEKLTEENEVCKDSIRREQIHNEVKKLKDEIKQFKKDTRKLIDLSHKILIFEDTPNMNLFEALMSLFSHDEYEIEYQYTETSGPIQTKINILRGWPVGIFAQAVDYSHYKRWPEVQRRFIITNPKMDKEKYAAAVDLTYDKFGLPDFVYQKMVSSNKEKDEVRDILLGLRNDILNISLSNKEDENPTLIPYRNVLKHVADKSKTSDMTAAKRIGGFISLLATINNKKRPTLRIVKDESTNEVQIIPLATFEDLAKTYYIIEDPTGIRPYVANWYHEIFIPAYGNKTTKNSITRGTIVIEEQRIAITTRELIDKTKEKWGKTYNSNQLLQTFIYPLLNQGYIDSIQSEIDKRSFIYYPLVTSKYTKLLYRDEYNNFSQQNKIVIEDPNIFPSKTYLEVQISGILKYYYEAGAFPKIVDHNNNEITTQELVNRYYSDADQYFECKERDITQLKALCIFDSYPVRESNNNIENSTSHNNNFDTPIIGSSYNENMRMMQNLDSQKEEESKKSLYRGKYNNLVYLEDSRYDILSNPSTTELVMGFNRNWHIRKKGRYWGCEFKPECVNLKGNDKWAAFSHGLIHEMDEVKQRLEVLKGFDLETQKKDLKQYSGEQLELLLAQVKDNKSLEKAILAARDYLIDGGRI